MIRGMVFRRSIFGEFWERPVQRQQNNAPCPASWALTFINEMFMVDPVIRTFANAETQRFWEEGRSRRLPVEIRKRTAMRLVQLDAATRLADLRLPPSNRLEPLRGERAGQWSIRINDKWRVCFRFRNGDAFNVEITDYH